MKQKIPFLLYLLLQCFFLTTQELVDLNEKIQNLIDDFAEKQVIQSITLQKIVTLMDQQCQQVTKLENENNILAEQIKRAQKKNFYLIEQMGWVKKQYNNIKALTRANSQKTKPTPILKKSNSQKLKPSPQSVPESRRRGISFPAHKKNSNYPRLPDKQ